MVTRILSIAAQGALALALVSPAAHAIGPLLPSPANSIVPSNIRLVGRDALGAPGPAGQFFVEVRNFVNTPIAGSLVIVSFANCSAARIASSEYPAGVTVDCRSTHLTIRRLTDVNGRATFVIPGG